MNLPVTVMCKVLRLICRVDLMRNSRGDDEFQPCQVWLQIWTSPVLNALVDSVWRVRGCA